MSESTAGRPERPAEVTDPLLWRLATAVAEAHEADEDDVCRNPSCVGAAWPCAAWTSAQEGLRAAQQAAPPTRSLSSADEGADDLDRGDPLIGWPSNLLPSPGDMPLHSPARVETPEAVASAA